MPFITEELWQKVVPLTRPAEPIGSLMHAAWPLVVESLRDETAESGMAFVQEVVGAVRTMRNEMAIPPGQKLTLLVAGEAGFVEQYFRPHQAYILPLARLSAWQPLTGDAPSGCATAVLSQMRLFIPLQGVINPEAESARLTREINRLDSELERVRGKLANPAFLSHAKAEVVQKEQHKEQDFQEKRQGIQEALQRIQDIGRAS